MKYFAMYCPVPGEPKAGDVFRSKWRTALKFWHYVQVCEVTEQGYRSVIVYPKEDCKYKVELFICSTESKIPNNPTPNFFSPETLPHQVIGKLSNKAIWVQHGMVFEESQIKRFYRNEYQCLCEVPGQYRSEKQATCEHMKDDYRGSDFCDRMIQVIDHIKILCPTCKTFH